MVKPTTGKGQVSNIYFVESTTKLPVTEPDFMYNSHLKNDAFLCSPSKLL